MMLSQFVLQFTMKLTFQQAARGVNKTIIVDVIDACSRCHGSKAEPGSERVKCPQCGGIGMVSTLGIRCCIAYT